MTIRYLNLTDPNYDVFHDNTRQRTPRTYYKATASNGRVALRGSWQDKYSHAVIKVENERYPNELITWASFHSSEQLGKRTLTRLTNIYSEKYGENNYSFELVALDKITAKEFRKYKSLEKKAINDYYKKLQEEATNANTK